MGKSLAQTPLTAIIFAAVWCFSAPFFPASESYSEALAAFNMPLSGYAYMAAYGLWLSIILALIFSNARGNGVFLTVLMAVTVLLTQWVVPTIRPVVFGETTGVMTQTDLILWLVQGLIATVFLLVMALLLFKPEHGPQPPRPPNAPPKKPDKYRLKVRNFIIIMIVLPVIYMVVFFLTWYFLLLGNEAARAFYSVGPDMNTFAKYLVDIMLNDSRQIPMALIKGLLYILSLIPLMLQLAHKRIMFILTTIMLLLGPALRMIIPTAVMPDAVRLAHLIEMSAAAAVYGAFAAFMMHMCVAKEQTKEPVHAAPPAKGQRPAAAGAATPAAPAASTKAK